VIAWMRLILLWCKTDDADKFFGYPLNKKKEFSGKKYCKKIKLVFCRKDYKLPG
jgi:hypothetical protein